MQRPKDLKSLECRQTFRHASHHSPEIPNRVAAPAAFFAFRMNPDAIRLVLSDQILSL